MIKAEELRIGNWVTYHGDTIEVTGIVRNTIHYKGGFDANTGEYRPYQPIPLTEQWLIDFGFEKKDEDRFLLDLGVGGNVLFITLLRNNETLAFLAEKTSTTPPVIYLGKVCNHVHQLQNLYFALTGQELKRKEVRH